MKTSARRSADLGRTVLLAFTVLTLAACGSDSKKFSIGGSASGLGGQVVLQNNGGDDLTVTGNGSFTFKKKIKKNKSYAVTILSKPATQTCVVGNGSGTATADVTNVTVTCTNNASYTVGGALSGLTSGQSVVLQNNGGDALALSTDGSFTFVSAITTGAAYNVTVQTQPTGQTCTVSNGSGVMGAANVTNVTVTCVSDAGTAHTIGGTISGLNASGLTLKSVFAGQVSPASGDTTFTLPVAVNDGNNYFVHIDAQPTGQTCVLLKAHGVVNGADVSNVDVRCIDNVTDPIVGTYTVPALSASNTSYVYITLYADGTYLYGSIENNGTGCGTANGGNGVEYGVYSYDATAHTFAIKSAVVDTNGGCGVWNGASRFDGTLTITGSGQGKVLSLTPVGASAAVDLVPVPSVATEIAGSFNYAAESSFVAFLPSGVANQYYTFFAESQSDVSGATDTGQRAGVEYGCASVDDPTSGTVTFDFSATCLAPAPDTDGAVDNNGSGGLSGMGSPLGFSVSGASINFSNDLVVWRIDPN